MNCFAFCTASAYDIKALTEHFKTENISFTLYRDAVHVQIVGASVHDIFYFSYGAIVFWGFSLEECNHYLNQMKPFEEVPTEEVELDEFTFLFGETASILEDDITLPNENVLTRLAVSHGIAQSVKLGAFENSIRRTFNHTKHIPEDLAKYGRISLSRKEIRRKMGELFIERNSINMHSDVLDTPEFFWKYPELDPFYLMTANYLDLRTRVEVLNQRLNVIHELFEMLGTELNHQHSNLLEWTIIGLIITEVALTLAKDFFRFV